MKAIKGDYLVYRQFGKKNRWAWVRFEDEFEPYYGLEYKKEFMGYFLPKQTCKIRRMIQAGFKAKKLPLTDLPENTGLPDDFELSTGY